MAVEHPGFPVGSSASFNGGMVAPPEWLPRVRATLDQDMPAWFAQFRPPPDPPRRSAVLLLFATPDRGGPNLDEPDRRAGLDIVLTERSAGLRSHAAQVSFPGGHLDPTDDGPISAAVREAEEEVGVDPATVDVVATLPALYLRPSGNAVTPVLAWWRAPHPIGVVDTREVARVARADLDHLLDPGNRFTVTAPGGYRGPGFAVDGLFIWGFTANLLSHVFDLAGLTRAWDEAVERPLPSDLLAPYLRKR
jgi:8-oxo-dGTP pyrophosphatase MutT (NUDIX family)